MAFERARGGRPRRADRAGARAPARRPLPGCRAARPRRGLPYPHDVPGASSRSSTPPTRWPARSTTSPRRTARCRRQRFSDGPGGSCASRTATSQPGRVCRTPAMRAVRGSSAGDRRRGRRPDVRRGSRRSDRGGRVSPPRALRVLRAGKLAKIFDEVAARVRQTAGRSTRAPTASARPAGPRHEVNTALASRQHRAGEGRADHHPGRVSPATSRRSRRCSPRRSAVP